MSLLCLKTYALDSITDIRFWHPPDKTRMVIDLTNGVGYKVFSLKNPNRLVVDLQNTKGPAAAKIPKINNKLIRGLRVAARNKTDTRLVIDLRHDIEMEHFALGPQAPYGHRIVVDLLVPKSLKPEEDPVLAIIQKRRFEQKETNTNAASSETNTTPGTTSPSLVTSRDIIIAIDAGHGGEDPGAIGQGKTQEKHVVLTIAQKLKQNLEAQPGVTAVLTRKDDYFVSLGERVNLAHQKYNADFFISVHADAAGRRSARGASVYVLGKSGVKRSLALYLSEQEKQGDARGSNNPAQLSSLNKVLADLSLEGSMSHSVLAARKVLSELGKVTQMHSNQVKYNNFQVLRNPYMPAILVETGFISNRKDEQLLQNRRHQDKLVQAIATGILDYFKKQPPPGTFYANQREHPVIVHVVKRNEFLSSIAKKYNTSVAEIRKTNNLKSDTIRIGQKLTITQGLK